ncbi:MAG TPA: ELWxxDGT repeat protein [Thermoanaerobaculia bacterium]
MPSRRHPALSGFLALLVLPGLLAGLPALAQPAFRVADLNPANPQSWSLSLETGRRIVVLGNALVFVADDGGEYGIELWRSDGTRAGTRPLKDICPGSCSSSPASLTVSNGLLFFTADDGIHGRELWKSDGTPEGTSMVAEILPGHSVWISDLIDASGVLYFFAEDGVHGYELWTSDGTPAGTHLVKDIAPGSGWINGRFLATSGHKLLFAAAYGIQPMAPWVSDGTEAGTGMVADIRPGADAVSPGYDPLVSGPDAAPAPQGGFLFAADDGTGTALWYTDGIPGGTTVRLPGAASPHEMTVFLGAVYFAAADAGGGVELWRSDGTAPGTVQVKDIRPGTEGSNPRELTVVGSQLFFRATDGATGAELWRSNGTVAGTARVADLNPGTGDAFPVTPGLPDHYQLSPFGSDLIFFAYDANQYLQLWWTDGFTTTTRLTTGGVPDYIPAIRKDTAVLGGRFYFISGFSNTQLWSSDGTPGGTNPIVDVTTATSSIQLFNGKTFPGAFAPAGNLLFFGATDGPPFIEPWKTDGTPGGTSRIASLPYGETIYECRPGGDGMVFQTNLGIWSSDGTASGTHSLGPGWGNLPSLGGTSFYLSSDPVNSAAPQQWLWKTDGTPAGTHPVAALSTFNDGGNLTPSGGKIFVAGFENGGGFSLWASDGTAPGTVHISGLAHGGGFSQLGRLVDFNGTLFFSAYEYGYGWQLWKSDGTAPGTTLVRASGFPSDPYDAAYGEAAALPGGPLFFVLRDAEAGGELWKSDGTAAGTVRVADILPGSQGSNPHRLTPAGDRLYFVADDGVHGDEPWVTDGTEAGTHMVADLLPGPDSSYPDSLTAVGTTLLFSAIDGVHGVEAWRTGGTATGTRMIQDIAPGPLSSSPSGFTAAGPNVYFAASDHTTGFELWAVPKDAVLGTFADVPPSYWASGFIEALAAAGVTGGCGGGQFCPGALINRAQMAIFLLAARDGAPPPPATGTRFDDVPPGYWAGPWIEELAAEGIVGGCSVSPPLYCPGNTLTRAEMAILLVGARHETPPPATGTRFADVPAGYWAARWIEQLAADGITSGCGGGNFCPDQPITRAEMAVFLVTAFHVPLP